MDLSKPTFSNGKWRKRLDPLGYRVYDVSPCGEVRSFSKGRQHHWTPETAEDAMQRWKSQKTSAINLAKEYGVSLSAVYRVVRAESVDSHWRPLKHSPHPDHDYPRVMLVRKDGKKMTHFVHHVVLMAWRGPCPPGKMCRHLDGNPANCHLDNLVWGTHMENISDRERHGTTSHDGRPPSLSPEQAKEACIRYANGERQRVIAKDLSVSPMLISLVVRKKGPYAHI